MILKADFFQGYNEWEPDSYLTSKPLIEEGKIKNSRKGIVLREEWGSRFLRNDGKSPPVYTASQN
jgi:hypothetical protein